MKYMHKKGTKIDGPKLGLGGRYYPIEKGVFEIPDDVDAELHARVVSAGHKPIKDEKKGGKKESKKKEPKKEAPKETPKEEKVEEKPAAEEKTEDKAEDAKETDDKPDEEAKEEDAGEGKEEAESEEKLTLADALMTVEGIGAGYSKQMIAEYKDAEGIKAASSKEIAKKIDGVTEKLADEAKQAIEKWEKGEL